ncbi:serine-rich adhesin for platelets isoform X1 [Nasonia vitripennis]|uniref:Uncharacterized protein n=1 Tax=Nasonia vitripennis TaxID=7425 RepID=A0A7M7M1M7_NASVI|nr:serine-rich adhesin for platelets isoform X1 [Nasonia vitripennis]
MSINVTVTGNPISIRRGKMALSDFEKMRKSEREHRKRLRLEQVNEQSRALAKKILERTRQIEQEQLDRLEKNGNTQMRREHERRLLEIQKRYHDLENIGYAHENAARQPDTESLKKAEEQRNQAVARERGASALQQLQETYKVASPKSKQKERLAKVRNLENQRSQMVSHLPQKSYPVNGSSDSLDNENITKPTTSTSIQKKAKCLVSKKTPIKKTPKHSKVPSSHTKTPPHISVSVNNERTEQTPTTATLFTTKTKPNSPSKLSKDPKTVSNAIQELSRGSICESDDNEPRRTVPVTSTVSNKPERLLRYTEHYEDGSSEVSSTSRSSSSISEDSSYFSDNTSKVTAVRKTPRHVKSPISSKVSVYDHNTRHQKICERPSGLVERLNIKNKPTADEMAQDIIQLEKNESEVLANQKECSKQRSQDALLREKARRDYQALMKQLDQLAKEERRLRATQASDAANQQVPAPSKNKENLKKHQKKMDRAFENILRTSREPENTNEIIERSITLTPHDYIHSNTTPATAWKEPCRPDRKEQEESYSEDDNDFTRKRKISELLIKIEKLKRSLLQEYGANLPDDIFNASLKSLFNQTSTSTSQERVAQNTSKLIPAPEIQVINMSSCDEAAKPVRKYTCKMPRNKKTPESNLTSKDSPKSADKSTMVTRDQEVQVELSNDQTPNQVLSYPLEPAVTIVTPENGNSSSSICSSDSSTATDLVIDVSKRDVTVVKSKENNMNILKDTSKVSSSKSFKHSATKMPVKISFEQSSGMGAIEVASVLIDPCTKKITVLKPERRNASKQSTDSKKSQSLPGSRVTSPSKKHSTSAPPSQQSSPKATLPQSRPAKRSEKCGTKTEEKRYRTQITQVSIDSSTESSQFNSFSDSGNGKSYSRFRATATSRMISQLQDHSDTSTTYASPPTAVAGALLNAMSSSTSILELLDSSANETIKRKMSEVSPVSSPETPSPRTTMIPSNIPRNGKVNKSLKFISLANMQAKSSQGSVIKSAKTSCSVSRDRATSTRPSRQMRQMHPCTCKNPECKLFHDKIEDTQDYALKHCPEVLKKYEDLQNVCTERIASLTDLIEKVRNEQKELSTVTNEDTAVHPSSQTLRHSQTSVDNGNASLLVRNVQSIHAQLKKTLLESQKLISGEGLDLPHLPIPFRNIEKSPSISMDLSRNTTPSESLTEAVEQPKRCPETASTSGKPRILNNERVNIRLDRFISNQASGSAFNGRRTSKAMTTVMSSTVKEAPDQGEHMVEMLQNEILEQSKSINKSVPADSLKDSDDSFLKSSQAPVKDSGESNRNFAVDGQSDDKNQEGNSEVCDNDFVPLLAGIPKIPRSLAKGSSNGRGRPPVTLISGPYRPEILSPAHELSTIVEFDTPETVNKSQLSTRSPSNRARRKLSAGGPGPSEISSPTKKSDAREPKNKPSVHVAPLPAHRSPQLNVSNKSSDKSPRQSVEKCSKALDKKSSIKDEAKNNSSSDSMCTLPDVHIEHLQQSQDNTDGNFDFRVSQISELQSLPDENIDQLVISELYEENKSAKSATLCLQKSSLEKQKEEENALIASSSSASFSGISGVSEITTSPSSDLNLFKCPSSLEEMELAFKKWGLSWAVSTLKKTREASALGSSSSSDVTPVNTATRLVSPVKKQQEVTAHDLPEISDVSSISIKHANKSTERSVLVKGRTSTPNRFSNSNSERTSSTLGSFSSELNIVVQNQSADMTIPNISFSNKQI